MGSVNIAKNEDFTASTLQKMGGVTSGNWINFLDGLGKAEGNSGKFEARWRGGNHEH